MISGVQTWWREFRNAVPTPMISEIQSQFCDLKNLILFLQYFSPHQIRADPIGTAWIQPYSERIPVLVTVP